MNALASVAGPLLGRNLATAEAMDSAVKKPRLEPRPSRRLAKDCRFTERSRAGFAVWDVQPARAEPTHAVLYLHGGAYTFAISSVHWSLIADVAAKTNALVCVPLYGLAPEHTHRDAYPLVEQAFDELAERFGADHVTIMGDSAGGGLAMGLAHALRDRGVTPQQVIAISPWLDLTLSHPDIAQAAARDPWLKRSGLLRAGELWADGDDPAHPRLSPLNGSLAGLPPITIYIGDRDIFLPDAREFGRRARLEGASVDVVVEPGALHVYPLLPVPEGRRARAAILQQLTA